MGASAKPERDFYSLGQQPPAEKQPDFYALSEGEDFYSQGPPIDTAAGRDVTAMLGAVREAPSFAEEHPILNALIEPVRDVSSYVQGALRFWFPSPTALIAERQGRFEVPPPEEQQRIMRGGALVASFVPSVGAARLAGRLGLKGGAKAVSFLAGEFLGGATYGAISPLEEGKTRTEQVLEEGGLFAVAGGAFAAVGHVGARLFRKYITRNLGTRGVALAVDKLQKVRRTLEREGTTLDALPPQVQDEILSNIYRETVQELEPNAAKIEGFIQNELRGAAEAREAAAVKSILPDPDEAFKFAEELPAPAGLEPTAAGAAGRPRRKPPKGFKPTVEEYVVTPVVRGASSKTYPGLTHPQAMADALARGVPSQEFEALGTKLEANFGYETSLRDFVDRKEAARLVDAAEGKAVTDRALDARELLPPPGPDPEIAATALADVAVRDAIAKIEPLDVATPEIREAVAAAREAPIVPPSSIDPVEQIQAAQPDIPAGATPIDEFGVAVRMGDADLEMLQRAFMQIAKAVPEAPSGLDILKTDLERISAGEAEFAREFAKRARGEIGAVPIAALGRLLSGGAGAGLMIGASSRDDPGEKSVLWALGGMLMATALLPVARAVIRGEAGPKVLRDVNRRFMMQAAPQWLMKTAGQKEGARRYIETLTSSRETAHVYREAARHIFPKDAYRAAQLAIDEMDAARGIFPAEFYQLTPRQRQGAIALNQLNKRLEQLARAAGVEEEHVRNYARRVLPSETYERWRQQGYVAGPGGTRRQLSTLREFEQFAIANALPEPILRLPDLQALRITEAYRAIGNANMRKYMQNLGLIQPGPTLATQPLPQGWRALKILGWRDKIAPEAVAAALENMSSPVASRSELINAADVLKSWWMRSIMFWFWEHGLNAMRALPLVAMNPAGLRHSWKAIADNDPLVMEAAKHGLNLRARTDYGLRSAKAFEEMAQKVGRIPLIRDIYRGGGWLIEKQDRFLWDQIIPSLQLFTYQTEMRKWAQRTGHKFLPGSAEYVAAGRKAADFANVVSGRVPTELANPQLLQGMRLLMFSPQWTSTRVALIIGAAGELGEVLAGKLNPLHGSYLPFKLRQVAWMVALTYVGSKILSGKEPEFNPRTNKFYMRTGLRNETGRETGLDLVGWWQDELKLFGDVFGFISGRANPVFSVATETISGRDFAGRDMTYPQRIVNLFQSVGPPAELLELGIRVGQTIGPGGAPGLTGGETLSRVSGVLATANVSALPRPIDAAVARMAEKLLDRVGLPKNDYLIFELGRLLRGNLLSGQDLIDNRVLTYLAYRRRNHGVHEPIAGAPKSLWETTRRIMAEF